VRKKHTQEDRQYTNRRHTIVVWSQIKTEPIQQPAEKTRSRESKAAGLGRSQVQSFGLLKQKRKKPSSDN
jgi:hypothetical protein